MNLDNVGCQYGVRDRSQSRNDFETCHINLRSRGVWPPTLRSSFCQCSSFCHTYQFNCLLCLIRSAIRRLGLSQRTNSVLQWVSRHASSGGLGHVASYMSMAMPIT
ncbi:hypothetical protein Csa_010132 [Cucumis sativus]|uniref:Uncharacterized protein n=1 Tax=Cucumis sativus TaxID=3659 RepID=A0A0A0LAA4_CUCSA|nr:hypothetical protein Csa_010132 [Cucumis sativus]